jgi:hypothetical protein
VNLALPWSRQAPSTDPAPLTLVPAA